MRSSAHEGFDKEKDGNKVKADDLEKAFLHKQEKDKKKKRDKELRYITEKNLKKMVTKFSLIIQAQENPDLLHERAVNLLKQAETGKMSKSTNLLPPIAVSPRKLPGMNEQFNQSPDPFGKSKNF